MGEHKEVVLVDLLQKKGYIRGPFGSALRRPEMKDEGVPVYEQQHAIYNLREFRYYIDDEKFEELKRFQVKTNDLIISCSGTVGKVSIIREDDPKGIISQALLILRADTSKVLPEYLKYFFSSHNGYNSIVSRSSGSVQVNISKRAVIEQIPLSLPDLSEQKMIVNVLKTIDDKILNNEKINRNLSDQLETVFAERFLSLDWNGDLPEGWKLTKLKDVAQFSQGVQVPVEEQLSNYEEGYERFIRIVDITQGNEKDIRYIEDRQRGHVEENEIFMIRYGTPGILSWNYRGIIANNLFKISSTTEEVTYNYLYSLLKTERLLGYLKGNAVSSTMPAINFSTLNGIDILIPDKKSMQDFSEFSETIRIHQLELIDENYSLTHLRDSLLPKLMNGEISVEDLEM